MMPLKKQLELTRLRFSYFFQWKRLLGLAATGVVGYLLVFVVFAKADMSWLFRESRSVAARFSWPDLPRFEAWKQTTPGGREETVYTVPSRQLTARELAQLETTNSASAPAAKN